jgi:hypothetical protein
MQAFIETAEDLRQRSALTATHYDATQAAALVRRLLMDRSPLAVNVAAFYNMALEFAWSRDTNVVGDDGARFLIGGGGLSPELQAALPWYKSYSPHSITKGTLDAFLAAPVIELSGNEDEHASVKAVIRVYAHGLGGVHWNLETDTRALEIVEVARVRAPRHLDWSMTAIA